MGNGAWQESIGEGGFFRIFRLFNCANDESVFMDLKHANGEQMTVEKLISFVPCEKKGVFFKDWKSNKIEFNRNNPNLQ